MKYVGIAAVAATFWLSVATLRLMIHGVPRAVPAKPLASPVDPTPSKKTLAVEEAGGGSECSITFNSIPWSEVWIDGKNTNRHTPLVDYKLPCGKHKISFKRPDMHIHQTESINLKPGWNLKHRYTLATDD